MVENNQINDAGDEHKYFSQIPHLIDDTEMSVYAFRLYVHIKRVVGKNGRCWQSTRTLADKCNMSVGKVSQAKDELKELGLIDIELVKDKKGEHHEITIVDIWPENMARYSQDEQACSCGEHPCSCGERTRSPGEPKNNPSKNNPDKNGGGEPLNIYQLYEKYIGPLTKTISEDLGTLEKDYALYWIEEAFEITHKKKKQLSYAKGILKRMANEGNGREPEEEDALTKYEREQGIKT